jgi:hypothetical protein
MNGIVIVLTEQEVVALNQLWDLTLKHERGGMLVIDAINHFRNKIAQAQQQQQQQQRPNGSGQPTVEDSPQGNA